MTAGSIQNIGLQRSTPIDTGRNMPESYARYRILSDDKSDATEFERKNVSFGGWGGKDFWKKFFEKFSDGLSDINSAWVTAIGTAIVAPIFIIFNPIAEFFNKRRPADPNDTRTAEQKKQDDRNQRIYSALRQPVSAIIAIAGQLALTKPLEGFLDSHAAKGYFNVPAETSEVHSKFNIINSNDYYNKIAKQELERENIEPSHKNITERRKAIIERFRADELERILREEPEMVANELKKINPNDPTTYSVLVEDSLKDSVKEDLERDMDFMKTVKNTDDEKFKKEVKRRANLKVRRAVDIEEKVINEWRSIVSSGRTDAKEISEELMNSKAIKELLEKARSEGDTEAVEIIEKTVKTVSKYDGKMKSFFLKALNVRTAILQNKFVRTALDYTKAHYKNRRLVLTILGNFLTLPITCTILNWIFPKIANRIMGINKPNKNEQQPVGVVKNGKEQVNEQPDFERERAVVGKAGV